MPTLNWIGRKAVENHHRQVPFHLLKEVPDLSVGDPGTGNLLVEGANPHWQTVIRERIIAAGLSVPVICTPQALIEGEI